MILRNGGDTLRHRLVRLFFTWLLVYPAVTLLLAVMQPIIENWSLPLQTLLLTGVLVPLLSLVVVPLANRAHRAIGSAGDGSPGEPDRS
ncbi:MAG: hypothetical protein AAGF72_01985 [Pseudomonadota bacterium]